MEAKTELTLAVVIDRVKKIEQMAGDPEAAHCEEDSLYMDVLSHIAKNATDNDIRWMAANALEASEIKFPRWCA